MESGSALCLCAFLLPPLSRLCVGFAARLEVPQCFPPPQLRADCATVLLITGDPHGLEQPVRELQSLVHPCRKAERGPQSSTAPRALSNLPPARSRCVPAPRLPFACGVLSATRLHLYPRQDFKCKIKKKNAFGCFFFFPKIFFPVTFFILKYLNTPLSKSLLP